MKLLTSSRAWRGERWSRVTVTASLASRSCPSRCTCWSEGAPFRCLMHKLLTRILPKEKDKIRPSWLREIQYYSGLLVIFGPRVNCRQGSNIHTWKVDLLYEFDLFPIQVLHVYRLVVQFTHTHTVDGMQRSKAKSRIWSDNSAVHIAVVPSPTPPQPPPPHLIAKVETLSWNKYALMNPRLMQYPSQIKECSL